MKLFSSSKAEDCVFLDETQYCIDSWTFHGVHITWVINIELFVVTTDFNWLNQFCHLLRFLSLASSKKKESTSVPEKRDVWWWGAIRDMRVVKSSIGNCFPLLRLKVEGLCHRLLNLYFIGNSSHDIYFLLIHKGSRFGSFNIEIIEAIPLFAWNTVDFSLLWKTFVFWVKSSNRKHHAFRWEKNKSVTSFCFIHRLYFYYCILFQIFAQGDNKTLIGRSHLCNMGSNHPSTNQNLSLANCYSWVKKRKFIFEFIFQVRLWTYPLNSGIPSIHPPPFLNQFYHKKLKVTFFFNHERVQRQKACLANFDLLIFGIFLNFLLLNTTKWTAINVQQSYKAVVADMNLFVFVFSTLCIEFVSFGLMIFTQISIFIFLQEFFVNQSIFLSLHPRFWLAGRFNFILKSLFRGFCSSKCRYSLFEIAICAWNVCLFHISDHFFFQPFTYFAKLAIHEGSSEFVIASFANFCLERDLMSFLGIIDALDDNIKEFTVLVLAKFSVFDKLFKFLRADKAMGVDLVRIFDDVGALIADFAHLRDAMSAAVFVLALKFDFVGEAFVEIMRTKRCVLHFMDLHIKSI